MMTTSPLSPPSFSSIRFYTQTALPTELRNSLPDRTTLAAVYTPFDNNLNVSLNDGNETFNFGETRHAGPILATPPFRWSRWLRSFIPDIFKPKSQKKWGYTKKDLSFNAWLDSSIAAQALSALNDIGNNHFQKHQGSPEKLEHPVKPYRQMFWDSHNKLIPKLVPKTYRPSELTSLLKTAFNIPEFKTSGESALIIWTQHKE